MEEQKACFGEISMCPLGRDFEVRLTNRNHEEKNLVRVAFKPAELADLKRPGRRT